MTFRFSRKISRWGIIIFSFFIISLILWNTNVFFQNFKTEERYKMQIWSLAQKEITKTNNLNQDLGELSLKILNSNTTTPMIVVSQDGRMSYRNIEEPKAKDTLYLKTLILDFQKQNEPIEIVFDNQVLSTLYYGNSSLINKIKYYPLALLLIIFLFAMVVYLFYNSVKTADQNKLWTGMAKETAHQIGTPLSSLEGWAEILRTEHINPKYIDEIEKDVERLKTITDRFSKIGSVPTLSSVNIIEHTKATFDYLKARSSKLIHFEINFSEAIIVVNLNVQLYSWTIENLVKNAIDAMKGKGDLTLKIYQTNDHVCVDIKDTGKGIAKSEYHKIFEPGYTTKKRGWGLGLSLAKRIIEEYHNGKIKVLKSKIGMGTTIQIKLKAI